MFLYTTSYEQTSQFRAMKSTVAEIEASLSIFRERSVERNSVTLGILHDAIVDAEFYDESMEEDYTTEEMEKERDEALADILEVILGDNVEGLETATDLLGLFDELAPAYNLDGTVGSEMEPEERAAVTSAYFDAVEAALKDKAPGEVRGIISVPDEFRVLAKHVVGLRGSGLQSPRGGYLLDFCDDESQSELPSRILAPDDVPGIHAVNDRVALGWYQETSLALGGLLTCIFVQESDRTWDWRYLWKDRFGDTRAFTSVTD